MSQALYRKWRPQSWGEVNGQLHVTQTLQNAVSADRIGHAYLFSGPRGTGKTSVARLLAKAANCLAEERSTRPCNQCDHCLAVNKGSFLDLIEIDAASNNGVDDVRDLRDKINFSPNQGKYKVYIIDEVHMLSPQAFNALLKTLEEPPPHAIFILATTEIHKIPATVLSRCQRHEFKRATVEDITGQLKEIAAAEKIRVDDEALTLIARQSTGSFRDAISLLDQMASTGQAITLEATHAILGTAASQNVLDLVDAIQNNQPAAGLNTLRAAMDAGTDARVLARQVVEYLRALLLIKLGNPDQANLPKETLKQAKAHSTVFTNPQILHMLREFNAVAADTRGSWQPSLGLELALAGVMLEPSQEKGSSILLSQAEVTSTQPVRPGKNPGQDKTLHKKSEPLYQMGESLHPQERMPQEKKANTQPNQGFAPVAKTADLASKEISGDFARLVSEWKNIKLQVKKIDPMLNGLLNSCRPLEIKKNTLFLGFDTDKVRDLAKTTRNIEVIQNTILEMLRMDIQVDCVTSNRKMDTPADIQQDGMVAAAIKAGGKITDIQD